ncbi:hypothetical protein EC991_009919 [Linnemannia zychae]|nr:hypothetical protein EC991_009919 [Linnemannia zychae]
MHIQSRVLATITLCSALAYLRLAEALPTNLFTCLQSTKRNRTSYLITPSSPTYNNERQVHNNIFDQKPSAIFHPTSGDDAAAAIVCASAYNVSIIPRSGGHSFEGYSGGGEGGSLVIDLNLLQHFSIDHNTGIATVGAGNRLGSLYTKLWDAGQYLIPAGSCPGVGIGGHALGGGMGMVGRKYGMLSDNIVEMTMVEANGNIRRINMTSAPELFWALRGAGGGSFGLVTEFKIQAFKAPDTVTTIMTVYPWSAYKTVINSFGTWAKNVTNEFTPLLIVNNGAIAVVGTFLGTKDETQKALASLIALTGPPSQTTYSEGTWYQAAANWADMEGAPLDDPFAEHTRSFRLRSLLYRRPISNSELTTIAKYIDNPPDDTPVNPDSRVSTSIIFEVWGGKIDHPSSASAFDNHRGTLYSIQYGVDWRHSSSASNPICTGCIDWIDRFSSDLQAVYSSGPTLEAYQNYIERDIPNKLQAYYGDNLSRLIDIKKTMDPNNIFRFPQSIPLS